MSSEPVLLWLSFKASITARVNPSLSITEAALTLITIGVAVVVPVVAVDPVRAPVAVITPVPAPLVILFWPIKGTQ